MNMQSRNPVGGNLVLTRSAPITLPMSFRPEPVTPRPKDLVVFKSPPQLVRPFCTERMGFPLSAGRLFS